MTRKTINPPSTDVTPVQLIASDDQLRNVGTFEDALRLVQEELGAQIDRVEDEVGTGFIVLDDKSKLEGVDFLAIMWKFYYSDDFSYRAEDGSIQPGQFVSIHLMTADGKKYIINDGTKGGIRDQLLGYTERHDGKCAGLMCQGGLQVSEYDYEDPSNGSVSKARSYYLARG